MAGDDAIETATLDRRPAPGPAGGSPRRPSAGPSAPRTGAPDPGGPPKRSVRRTALLLVLLATLLVGMPFGTIAMVGREAIWEHMFGPPDLGPYDFTRPTRTGKMNDALACPEGACLDARPSVVTPAFPADAATLYRAVREILAAKPTTRFVAEDPAAGQLRAVVRTPLLRFPDTLSLEVRPLGPGTSALYAYSRSQIGHADLGANAERLHRPVDALQDRLAPPG